MRNVASAGFGSSSSTTQELDEVSGWVRQRPSRKLAGDVARLCGTDCMQSFLALVWECCAALTALLADAQITSRTKGKISSRHTVSCSLLFFLTSVCTKLEWPVCQTGPSSSLRCLQDSSTQLSVALRRPEEGRAKARERSDVSVAGSHGPHGVYIFNQATREMTVGAPGKARCNAR